MINIVPLTSECEQQALDFVAREFVQTSNLHQALEIGVSEYRSYLAGGWRALISQNLSLIALDTHSNCIAGCLIATRFVPSQLDKDCVPENLWPLKKLLAQLEARFVTGAVNAKQNAMLVDLAVVSKEYQRRGLYTQLRLRSHGLGLEKGFSTVIGELSSSVTQHICVKKFGHRITAEIRYDEFEFKNTKPFSSITDPCSIQLVEGNLISDG